MLLKMLTNPAVKCASLGRYTILLQLGAGSGESTLSVWSRHLARREPCKSPYKQAKSIKMSGQTLRYSVQLLSIAFKQLTHYTGPARPATSPATSSAYAPEAYSQVPGALDSLLKEGQGHGTH